MRHNVRSTQRAHVITQPYVYRQGQLDYGSGCRFAKSELSLGSKPTVVSVKLHNHHR